MASTTQPDQRTLPELLGELAGETKSLVKKELELARAELSAKAEDMKLAALAAMSGLALMFSGVLILLFGAVYGLALSMPLWVAALIVGAIASAGGVLLLKAGVPDNKPGKSETEKSIRESAQAIKEEIT
ncbi:MAG: phage holin family protein [Myxococcota bacterium]|nr:phage holin family protein [Myxococcota bacterium]